MTTNNPVLAKGWKPSPLMVRILTAFVFLGVVIGLVLAGIYGVYLLVLILGGLALYEFNGLSDPDVVRALYRASRTGCPSALALRDGVRTVAATSIE